MGQNEIEWVCTDPDTEQYGRKISDGVFQFKEGDGDEETIVLANFSDEEILSNVLGFYDSVEELREIYGDSSEWIIAECIFEQM